LKSQREKMYAELAEGFKPVEEQLAAKEQAAKEAEIGAAAASKPMTLQVETTRPASAVGPRRSVTKLERPGSSPAGGVRRMSSQGGVGTKASANGMPRINSAPSGLERASRPGSAAGGLRMPSPVEITSIDPLNWGPDASHRFRLYSAVKSGKNSQRHCTACGGTEGVGYKCQLCERQHVMVASF
jgi:hypothetical protein